MTPKPVLNFQDYNSAADIIDMHEPKNSIDLRKDGGDQRQLPEDLFGYDPGDNIEIIRDPVTCLSYEEWLKIKNQTISQFMQPVKKDPKKKRIEVVIDLEVVNEKECNSPDDLIQFIETLKLNIIQKISEDLNKMNLKLLKKGCSNTFINVVQINTEITCK